MDVDFLKYRFEDGHEGLVTRRRFKLGVRHLQMLYMFACCASLGALRGSTGVAVAAVCDHSNHNQTIIQVQTWDRRVQGMVLSSFLFGYAVMLVPAELYVRRAGAKLLLTAVLLTNGILSVAMPTIVKKGGWVAMCNAQLIMGMTQACLSPANRSLLATWLPPNERGIFSCLVYGGVLCGVMVGMPAAGALAEKRLGWELVFYTQAMLALSMGAMWGLLTANSPQDHQAVGDAEKEFIEEAQKSYCKKTWPRPWRAMVVSRACWATACAHTASNAAFVFCLLDAPAYLHALQPSLADSSLQVTLGFASMWVVHLTMAPTVQWLFSSGYITYILSTTRYRKLINAIGASGTVIGLTVLSSSANRSAHWSVLALMGALGSLSFQYSGFLESYGDMSPNFAGTLVMMSSTLASLVGAAVPFVTGFIVGDSVTDVSRWQTSVLVLACFYVLCNAIYTTFGSSERQSWDGPISTKFGYHNHIDTNQLELEELSVKKPPHNDTEA